jgi:hypothetical protein
MFGLQVPLRQQDMAACTQYLDEPIKTLTWERRLLLTANSSSIRTWKVCLTWYNRQAGRLHIAVFSSVDCGLGALQVIVLLSRYLELLAIALSAAAPRTFSLEDHGTHHQGVQISALGASSTYYPSRNDWNTIGWQHIPLGL